MTRLVRLSVALLALAAVTAPVAAAHSGNPNYRSVLRAVQPQLPGVKVEVIGYDSFLRLTSRADRPVLIYGYNGEPYARILPDGTVQENHNSPAYWLNQDRFGGTPVPGYAKSTAAPDWKYLDKSGQLTWHDHRMHWMAKGKPEQVTDAKVKTKIYDYRIPIAEGGRPAKIEGTLYWVGSGGGPSTAAILGMIALVLVALIGSVLVIRRRNAGRRTATTPRPEREAW